VSDGIVIVRYSSLLHGGFVIMIASPLVLASWPLVSTVTRIK